MKNISVLLSFILLSSITAIGQLRLGEIQTGLRITSMVQTADGGYAMAGAGWTVIKLDSNGNLTWTRAFAGANNYANSIVQTKDKGYAVGGYNAAYGGMCLAKLDVKGNTKWIEGIAGNNAYCTSVIQARDGGYLVGGSSDSSGIGKNAIMFIVKADSVGKIKWACAGTNGSVAAVVQTSDGGFAALGDVSTPAGGANGAEVVKLDSTGKSQWAVALQLANPSYSDMNCTSMAQTIDKGYVIGVGRLAGFYAGIYYYDMYVIKLDSVGRLKWSWKIARDQSDWGNSITATKDGGCVIAGADYTSGDEYAVRLDSAGSLVWDRTYLGQTGLANSVIQTKDNGFALAGGTFIKVDSMGNSCQATGYGGSNFTRDTLILTNTTGMVYAYASVPTSGIAMPDTTAAAITSICQVVSVENINAGTKSSVVFPNPGKGIFTITNIEHGISNVEVYNVLGERVFKTHYSIPNTEYNIDISTQPDGIYLYRVMSDSGNLIGTGKLVIQK
jgi:hypothetical protein